MASFCHDYHIMHVQTIPKSPPKIIVQVAKGCDFFFALSFCLECDRYCLMHGAYSIRGMSEVA